MRTFNYLFLALAALGFGVSLLVNVLAWLNIAPPFGNAAFVLHLGVFVVAVPLLLMAQQGSPTGERKDFWKVALRGCPLWLRRSVPVIFVYDVVNFLFLVLNARPKSYPVTSTPPIVFRGFSGHWMAFYCLAFAVFYSWSQTNNAKTSKL